MNQKAKEKLANILNAAKEAKDIYEGRAEEGALYSKLMAASDQQKLQKEAQKIMRRAWDKKYGIQITAAIYEVREMYGRKAYDKAYELGLIEEYALNNQAVRP